MAKVDEAEQFLREGLRANPGNHEILFELGRVYDENRHDPARARNLWEAALRNWTKLESIKPEPDSLPFIQITSHLARLEEKEGNITQAIRYMELWKTRSPNPDAVQKQITDLNHRLHSSVNTAPETPETQDNQHTLGQPARPRWSSPPLGRIGWFVKVWVWS